MIVIKPGVRMTGVQGEMFEAAVKLEKLYGALRVALVITSGTDSRHSTNSRHFCGYALDFRTRNVPESERPELAEDAARVLGELYDVVLESDHLHVEYDPRAVIDAGLRALRGDSQEDESVL